jgi:hypothetical protein
VPGRGSYETLANLGIDLTGLADGDTLVWDAAAKVFKTDPPSSGTKRADAIDDPQAIALYDTFDRADNASAVGTSDSGATWTVAAGTWGITSEQLKLQAVSATLAALVYDVGVADVSVIVTIDVSATTPQPGVLLRYTDVDNCLYAKVYNSGIRLFKRVAGVETQLIVFSSTTQAGNRRRLRFSVVGIVVSCTDPVTGLQVGASHTLAGGDETTFAAQTKVGLGEVASAADRISTYKNIVIRTPF